jgi:hypothetical protein
MITINVTLKIDPKELRHFEGVLNNRYEVIDLNIRTDTDELYNNDPTFRKMLKKQKEDKKILNDYINMNN